MTCFYFIVHPTCQYAVCYSIKFSTISSFYSLGTFKRKRCRKRHMYFSYYIVVASPLAPVHILPYLISYKMTIIANRIFPLQKSTVALPWNWDRIRCQGERGNENVAEIRAWLSIHWQMLVESVWVLSTVTAERNIFNIKENDARLVGLQATSRHCALYRIY